MIFGRGEFYNTNVSEVLRSTVNLNSHAVSASSISTDNLPFIITIHFYPWFTIQCLTIYLKLLVIWFRKLIKSIYVYGRGGKLIKLSGDSLPT